MSFRLGAAAVRLAAASKQAVQGAGRAGLTTTPATRATPSKQYAPVPRVLQEKMKLFQQPNNLPVHIKGGAMDKVLYFLTAGVCTVGVIECVHVWYVLSYPPEK